MLAVARPSSTGAQLHLELADGGVLTVNGVQMGSDPNVVTALVEHFRTHPDHRDQLTDGVEAVRTVEELTR